ncbi:MAG: nucleotidyltransferase family protein [Candidatus Omnitrophica bacterium]|nr:nucleotidyltransferase family protein [Candidatus Omnitrophota bacterium]MCB9748194.1 nucleotidyltransferase family protein [Candidatus Omnitrophota bacterium]
MLSKDNIIKILNEEKAFLKKQFGIKRIAIFGSFAKGTQEKNSDIDIFVEYDKPLGLRFIHLIDYLDGKLGRKTDILTPGGIQGIRLKKVAEDIKRSLIYV